MNARIVFADVHWARAKGFNLFGERRVNAADKRGDQHYRHDANDYANDRKERTQLVGTQRGQGQPEILENVATKQFHKICP